MTTERRGYAKTRCEIPVLCKSTIFAKMGRETRRRKEKKRSESSVAGLLHGGESVREQKRWSIAKETPQPGFMSPTAGEQGELGTAGEVVTWDSPPTQWWGTHPLFRVSGFPLFPVTLGRVTERTMAKSPWSGWPGASHFTGTSITWQCDTPITHGETQSMCKVVAPPCHGCPRQCSPGYPSLLTEWEDARWLLAEWGKTTLVPFSPHLGCKVRVNWYKGTYSTSCCECGMDPTSADVRNLGSPASQDTYSYQTHPTAAARLHAVPYLDRNIELAL